MTIMRMPNSISRERLRDSSLRSAEMRAASISLVAERRHDAENQQRDEDLDQREAAAARTQGRSGGKGGHGVVWPCGVVSSLRRG